MSSSTGPKTSGFNEKLSSNGSIVIRLCRSLFCTGAILYLGAILIFSYPPNFCNHSNLEVKKLETSFIPVNDTQSKLKEVNNVNICNCTNSTLEVKNLEWNKSSTSTSTSTSSSSSSSTMLNNGHDSILDDKRLEPIINDTVPPTNINHLLFGLMGSENAVHSRKAYTELWWRAGVTKGYLYLDKTPTGDLLPWPRGLPPYRIYDDINNLIQEVKPRDPVIYRMNHGILEIIRENKRDFRWLVLGDDDSIFFVDNLVDVLSKYDHTKYYYFGGQSEFIMENYLFSFHQGFGGGGLILSYPLAKALTRDMEHCLRRSSYLVSSDQIAMACIGDIGVSLTPIKGLHQVDLRGDLSGFLSSHPKAPVLSLHHLDMVNPIFPKLDRYRAGRLLMRAARFDQSRLLQQTICHETRRGWTVSTSWGYSVHIYERILPRWWLQYPIETFSPWLPMVNTPPLYMFNTRKPFGDPCEAPHVFFFRTIRKISKNAIRTSYYRSAPRRLPPCLINGNHTADHVSVIHVYSPITKRKEIDRCECCNVDVDKGAKSMRITYRECRENEVIAE